MIELIEYKILINNLKSFNLLIHKHILYKDLTEHFLIKKPCMHMGLGVGWK